MKIAVHHKRQSKRCDLGVKKNRFEVKMESDVPPAQASKVLPPGSWSSFGFSAVKTALSAVAAASGALKIGTNHGAVEPVRCPVRTHPRIVL